MTIHFDNLISTIFTAVLQEKTPIERADVTSVIREKSKRIHLHRRFRTGEQILRVSMSRQAIQKTRWQTSVEVNIPFVVVIVKLRSVWMVDRYVVKK